MALVNNVVIQIKLPDNLTEEQQHEFVQDTISTMNQIISMSELEADPVIIGSEISQADIDE